MRPYIVAPVLILIIVLADLCSYRTLRLLNLPVSGALLPWVHFGISALFISGMLLLSLRLGRISDPGQFRIFIWFMGFFLLFYIPRIFLGITTLVEWLAWITARLFSTGDGPDHFTWILKTGGIIATLVFLLFAEGIFIGRTHLKVREVTVPSARLPESFDGLRVVQISDIHLGGFYGNTAYMERMVKMINKLDPDLILFTGDLVNTFATEATPFLPVLAELRAGEGKYAVLGNHDYGTYFRWPTSADEQANLEGVKQAVRDAGFRLLLNEQVQLTRGEDTITIAGVENWGKPPFPQVGDLEKALNGEDFFNYTILLSHDPSHWEAEVLPLSETDLTLSGHTHAMQIGIDLGKFRWSPSGWMYKQWGGLYEKDGRYLYVNRGVGYTAFPGRVGIRPEITVLTLKTEKSK